MRQRGCQLRRGIGLSCRRSRYRLHGRGRDRFLRDALIRRWNAGTAVGKLVRTDDKRLIRGRRRNFAPFSGGFRSRMLETTCRASRIVESGMEAVATGNAADAVSPQWKRGCGLRRRGLRHGGDHQRGARRRQGNFVKPDVGSYSNLQTTKRASRIFHETSRTLSMRSFAATFLPKNEA